MAREIETGLKLCVAAASGDSFFFLKAKLDRMVAGLVSLFVAGMLFLSVGPRGAQSAPRKAVTARLAAKWPATPLLLEARCVHCVRGGGGEGKHARESRGFPRALFPRKAPSTVGFGRGWPGAL